MSDPTISTRSLLRLYQAARRDVDVEQMDADLQLLQTKDVDLSIRLGAILAFNALLIGSAIQPIVASPGAPLALDAPTQPFLTLLTATTVALLAVSGFIAVRAITLGEEFSDDGLEGKPDMLIQRFYAAYCTSIDRQRNLLATAIKLTVIGLSLTTLTFALILADKLLT